jgi:hypothetical protein
MSSSLQRVQGVSESTSFAATCCICVRFLEQKGHRRFATGEAPGRHLWCRRAWFKEHFLVSVEKGEGKVCAQMTCQELVKKKEF